MSDASFAQGLLGVTLDGRYRLEAVLGEGGMGSVFRATHLAMDRKVAVKLLKPHLTGDKTALERFSREARATLKVDSPHAVKVLDFGVTPLGDYYMVLEYLDGRTVQRELEIDGTFAPPRVAHIARQALHALGAAHAQGLIHRDVKPENLLLMRVGSDGDYTKVLDFGVAKLMQGAAGDPAQLALTAAGMVFGTPEFMSPEQACGQPLDGRSDLYSLAATMFAMLTGTTLFEGTTAIEWLTHHVRTPAPPLATVRPELAAYPELDALLQRCLAKPRELRPETAAEMARLLAELEPVLARGPASAPPRTASKPGPIHASGYVEVLRGPGSTLLPAVAVPPGAATQLTGPAAAAPASLQSGEAGRFGPDGIAGAAGGRIPDRIDRGETGARGPGAVAGASGARGPGAVAGASGARGLGAAGGRAPAADRAAPTAIASDAASRRSRRRLAVWLGGITVASVIGLAIGLSVVGSGEMAPSAAAGSAAAPMAVAPVARGTSAPATAPEAAAGPTPAASSAGTGGSAPPPPSGTTPAVATIPAGTGSSAPTPPPGDSHGTTPAVATIPAGTGSSAPPTAPGDPHGTTPAVAAVPAGTGSSPPATAPAAAPGTTPAVAIAPAPARTGGSRSAGSRPAQAPTVSSARAPAADAHSRIATAQASSATHRPEHTVAPADPETSEHLREAEDAYRSHAPPLRQLAAADLVLRADPGNVRAHFLAGDALIRSGDIDNGCKYLAKIRQHAAARTRARAAGCPGD